MIPKAEDPSRPIAKLTRAQKKARKTGKNREPEFYPMPRGLWQELIEENPASFGSSWGPPDLRFPPVEYHDNAFYQMLGVRKADMVLYYDKAEPLPDDDFEYTLDLPRP